MRLTFTQPGLVAYIARGMTLVISALEKLVVRLILRSSREEFMVYG